ncbi:MAG: hypothetical protein ABIH21_05505, partial [Patescibacteria group bacterium]
KDDYNNKENPQRVFSNEIVIRKINSNVDTVIKACKNNSGKNGLVECIYIAAKNSIDDLDLAVDLCKEIENMNHGFKDCYIGVALMLRKAGQDNKVDFVCSNYKDKNKLDECLSIGVND